MPHVCIVTRSAPATNPRVVKEAVAFLRAGWQVSAVVGAHRGWSRTIATSFPVGELTHFRAIEFGPGAPSAARVVQLARRWSALTWWRMTASSSYWVALRASHDVTIAMRRAAEEIKADLYIAHYVAALPAAAAAARRHNSALAFDAEDFHAGEFDDSPAGIHERRITQVIETAHLGDCSFTTAASPGIADAYAATYGIKPPSVVLNVFPRSNAPTSPSSSGDVDLGPSLYWYSQTIGPNRGLECIVRAMARTKAQVHLYLRGSPASSYLDKLGALAAECGVGSRIHILPVAPPDDLERLGSQYDLGLVTEVGHTENRRIALTNKLFSYLLSGIGVVASNIEAHRKIAASLGEALSLYDVEEPDSLAAAIDQLLLDPERLARSRLAAWELAQKTYNWDVEQEKLVELAHRAVDDRRRGLSASIDCSRTELRAVP